MPKTNHNSLEHVTSQFASRQFIKFLSAGGVTVVVDYASFALLYGVVKTPLVVASTLSLLIGFMVSFTLNKIWVFGARKKVAQKQTTMQLVLYAVLLGFNTVFAYVFIWGLETAGVSAYIGKAMSILLIMFWNFVIYKQIIFRLLPDPK